MTLLSRFTALASLSLRRPTNLACRTCCSGVQSANSTSATSCGFTQCCKAASRVAQRCLCSGFVPNGDVATSIFFSRVFSLAAVSAVQPVPTLPT